MTDTITSLWSIELDIAYDAEHDREVAVQTLVEEPSSGVVRYELVREVGPGGGWPVYRFTGTFGQLAELLLAYAVDPDDAADLLKTAKAITT